MRTDDIEYVLRVAAAGSLSAAASTAHISVPALSEAVRRVENYVGCRIFTRSPSGMAPTQAGRRILDQLADVNASLESLRVGHDRLDHALRIGCPQGAWYALIETLRGTVDCPGRPVTLSTHVHYPTSLLTDGTIDFALLPAPTDLDHLLRRVPVFTEPRLVSCSATSALAQEREASLEELDRHPWMSAPSDADRRYTTTHRCDDLRGGPPPILGPTASDPIDIAAHIARGEFLVGGCPSISAMFDLSTRGVVDVFIADARPWHIDIVWLADNPAIADPDAHAIADQLRELAAATPTLTPLGS